MSLSTILELILKGTDNASGVIDTVAGKVGGLGTSMTQFGSNMAGVGKQLSMGLTAPIVAMGTAAVMMAADLKDAQDKTIGVFGDMSESVLTWSETSNTAMGISQEQALQTAATYGNLFDAMGIGVGVSAEMSQSMVQLAADVAEFNSADPSAVMDAFMGAMSGRTIALKQYGIDIDAARVKQIALSNGWVDEAGNVTSAGEAMATYQLIMEQTTKQQGTFANSTDDVGVQMAILKATVTDAAAELGTQLLPYVSQLVGFISDLVQKFSDLSPTAQKTILIVAGIAAAIGPLLVIFGTLISSVGSIITFLGGLGGMVATVSTFFTATLIPAITAALPVIGSVVAAALPVIAILAAIAAAIALLVVAWQNDWGGIQEKTAAVVAWIQGAIDGFVAWITESWTLFLEFIRSLWETDWMNIQTIFTNFATIFQSIWAALKSAFEGDWFAFGENLRAAWDAVWENIKLIFSNAWDTLVSIATSIVDGIKAAFEIDWGAVGQAIIDAIVQAIKDGIDAVVDAALSVVDAAVDAVEGFLGIESPSKRFLEIGQRMMEGLSLGIQRSVELPEREAVYAAGRAYSGAAAAAAVVNQYQYSIPIRVGRVDSSFDVNMIAERVIQRIKEMRRQ